MPAKVLPPPPRPDPVTLDRIYVTLTSSTASLDEKAYHLVALGTVAFHPSVKLFLYEVSGSNPGEGAGEGSAAAAANDVRREAVLKSIAFFLAQRNNAVCEECRWETVSLLGELCRMEKHDNPSSGSPQAQLEAKLNDYARRNLEYLALVPWFVPAAQALLDAADKKNNGTTGHRPAAAASPASSSSAKTGEDGGDSSHAAHEAAKKREVAEEAAAAAAREKLSREELKLKLRAKQRQLREDGSSGAYGYPQADAGFDADDDVVVALKDILNALPAVETVRPHEGSGGGSGSNSNNDGAVRKKCVWTPEALTQAHDLMFLDASTNLLHLIPTVSRCYSDTCAMCRKTSTGQEKPFLRCSSCKAVYYCSAACQQQHWAHSHRQPCRTFKERCEHILAEYYKANSSDGKAQGHKRGAKRKDKAEEAVTVLEVPLEPSLLYETRRYLYDHRDSSFGNVSFYDYFMKYNVRGS